MKSVKGDLLPYQSCVGDSANEMQLVFSNAMVQNRAVDVSHTTARLLVDHYDQNIRYALSDPHKCGQAD